MYICFIEVLLLVFVFFGLEWFAVESTLSESLCALAWSWLTRTFDLGFGFGWEVNYTATNLFVQAQCFPLAINATFD